MNASPARIPFTPQLRDWVVDHVDRGVPPAALVRSLVQEGIDSGPGLEADAVFARLRSRIGQSPSR